MSSYAYVKVSWANTHTRTKQFSFGLSCVAVFFVLLYVHYYVLRNDGCWEWLCHWYEFTKWFHERAKEHVVTMTSDCFSLFTFHKFYFMRMYFRQHQIGSRSNRIRVLFSRASQPQLSSIHYKCHTALQWTSIFIRLFVWATMCCSYDSSCSFLTLTK